ncbi:hypothetical protein [Rhabdochlamydiaceae symbiont of Dictyostelium giganteum]|uniref:hypothetical protein n=1 Tax=Rhabdochlamydiaceae symbiont of Dictyostelium giganteum TaxID=3342349 RepID=UPI00384C79C9
MRKQPSLHSVKHSLFCRKMAKVHQDITALEDKIDAKLPMYPKNYALFMKKLGKMSSLLLSLEKMTPEVKIPLYRDLKTMREKIITLYSLIDSAYLDTQIDQLRLTSTLLKSCVQNRQKRAVIQKTNDAREQIHHILAHFLPSFKERRVLVMAKLVIEQAEYFLLNQTMPSICLSEKLFEEAEMILEEVADYLTDNNPKAIKALMKSVSLTQKKIISAYLEPKDLLTNVLHDVERAAHQNVRFAS